VAALDTGDGRSLPSQRGQWRHAAAREGSPWRQPADEGGGGGVGVAATAAAAVAAAAVDAEPHSPPVAERGMGADTAVRGAAPLAGRGASPGSFRTAPCGPRPPPPMIVARRRRKNVRRAPSLGTAKGAGALARRQVISLGCGEVARRSSDSRQQDGSQARAACNCNRLEIAEVQLGSGYQHPPPANTGSTTLLVDLSRTQITFSVLGKRTHVGTGVPS